MNALGPERKLEEARSLCQQGHFSQALPLYERLVRQFPNKPFVWLEYAVAAGKTGNMDSADRAFQKASYLEPNNADLALNIGHQYRSLRQAAKSRAWYEKAARLNPTAVNPKMALAILEEQNHRFAESRAAIEACFKIDPQDDQARYFSSLLDRREKRLPEAESSLRHLIASNPQHPYVRYASRYDLAEILDRSGRFDDAMQMLNEAKAIVLQQADIRPMLHEYDVEAEQMARTTAGLSKDILEKWSKEFPERDRSVKMRLAFLGGHPRSGTTLLEQILAAHPNVAAFDESSCFNLIACQLFNAAPASNLPRVIDSPRLNFIRRKYFEGLEREWTGSLKDKLVLDKNPSPTSKLRVWLKIFPEVRTIIALRDPRDVVLSCYFQNIPLNPYSANFLSLDRIAKHYADLMSIWLMIRQWEGLQALETRYEDVVKDLEAEANRVNTFLGLDWNPAQALFHEESRKKQMYSPTYHDASQPVYARSVARWHSYKKHLEPILPILEPFCQALGYS